MADNYTQATVDPSIPKEFITDAEIEILEGFGIHNEPDQGGTLYFFAEEYCGSAYVENAELVKEVFPEMEVDEESDKYIEEDCLIEIFQRVIKRSKGKIPFISLQAAYYCSKMRPGEFGGFAYFITEDKFESTGTGQWVLRMEDKFKRKASGQATNTNLGQDEFAEFDTYDVTLTLKLNNKVEGFQHPELWDWFTLLDLGPDEAVNASMVD